LARSLGVREPDMERAKTSLVAAWRSQVGTVEGLAGLAGSALADGRPLASVETYPARIAAVTREDVRRAAERWLDASELRIVVVGSADVRKDLASLGLGQPEQRDAWGAPLE
jgi:predicted Zn-dependent peptidase